MAGEFTRIRRDIWADDEFLALSVSAQWLYFYLLTSDINLAGVADWRPKRITPRAVGLSPDVIESAAQELTAGLYIVVDEDTEEALVRSFIKHDGLLKQPNMGVAVAKAYRETSSKMLRGVIVHELRKLARTGGKLNGMDKLSDVLEKPSIDPSDLLAERLHDAAF